MDNPRGSFKNVPGSGDRLAELLVKLLAYCGLAPATVQSGETYCGEDRFG